MTLLRRLGNKERLADRIIQYFPSETNQFVDLFFGSGSMTIKMARRCKHIFANDIDDDVFNLFQVIQNNREELYKQFELMPQHSSLFKYWNKSNETDKVMKAVRFVFLSNFGYMGKTETFHLIRSNSKENFLSGIEEAFRELQNVKFSCCDFRDFFKNLTFKEEKEKTLIYADPPYLSTTHNYKNGFSEKDFIELLEVLTKTSIRFCISEFNNEFIIREAQGRNLNVVELGERRTLKNRNVEILIMNYSPPRQMKIIL